jgi:hypothetical protein
LEAKQGRSVTEDPFTSELWAASGRRRAAAPVARAALALLLLGVGPGGCAWERDVTVRAWVVDDRPRQGDPVTVVGRLTARGTPVAGAPMRARWRLSTDGTPRVIERACPAPGAMALTDAAGRAACAVAVPEPGSPGDEGDSGARIVAIDVSVHFSHAGRTYRATARAWPRPPPPTTPGGWWRGRTSPGAPATETE